MFPFFLSILWAPVQFYAIQLSSSWLTEILCFNKYKRLANAAGRSKVKLQIQKSRMKQQTRDVLVF